MKLPARSRIAVTVLIAATVLTGCGTQGTTPSPDKSTASASPTHVPISTSAPSDLLDKYPCLESSDTKGYRGTGKASDSIDMIELPPTHGPGTVGVLLSHQVDGGMCQLIGFGRRLAAQGYRVILPDYNTNDLVPVAASAADILMRDGARSTVLVGTSMGGTVSLAVAPKLPKPPRAIISLSGPTSYDDADAESHARDITSPVLLVAGADDDTYAQDAKSLNKDLRRSPHELHVLRGVAAHGVDLLPPHGAAAKLVTSFLTKHAPPK